MHIHHLYACCCFAPDRPQPDGLMFLCSARLWNNRRRTQLWVTSLVLISTYPLKKQSFYSKRVCPFHLSPHIHSCIGEREISDWFGLACQGHITWIIKPSSSWSFQSYFLGYMILNKTLMFSPFLPRFKCSCAPGQGFPYCRGFHCVLWICAETSAGKCENQIGSEWGQGETLLLWLSNVVEYFRETRHNWMSVFNLLNWLDF